MDAPRFVFAVSLRLAGRGRSLTLLTALLLGAPPAPAQTRPHPVMSAFMPDSQYQLVVDGTTVESARIFLSKRAAAYLVIASELPDPIVMWARSGRVDSVPESSLLTRDDGGLDIADGTPRSYLGDLHPEGTDVVVELDAHDVRLRPPPPLVGSHDLDELLEHSPDYAAGLSAYAPDATAIGELENLASDVRVRIFFGSWCAVCKRFIPNALRIERELAGSEIRFEHYGLDNPPEGWNDPEVKAHGVTALPTAIVYRGEEELGRLVGAKDFAEPERALLELLSPG